MKVDMRLIAVAIVVVIIVSVFGIYTGVVHTQSTCSDLKSNYGTIILSYDKNANDRIDRDEVNYAVQDYYANTITKAQADAVYSAWWRNCDLSGWHTTPNEYILTTSVSPADAGIIWASPAQDTYAEGTEVTVYTTPNDGWTFDHWTLSLSAIPPPGNTESYTVIMAIHPHRQHCR